MPPFYHRYNIEMIALCEQRNLSASPASGWWWICLLTTLLFIFQVNYSRIHLLTETHHTCGDQEGSPAAVHHHDHTDAEHGDDEHQPHSQSEHLLQLVAKQQSSYDVGDLAVSGTHPMLIDPERHPVHSPSWQDHQPAHPPPDPAQPRAPPTA